MKRGRGGEREHSDQLRDGYIKEGRLCSVISRGGGDRERTTAQRLEDRPAKMNTREACAGENNSREERAGKSGVRGKKREYGDEKIYRRMNINLLNALMGDVKCGECRNCQNNPCGMCGYCVSKIAPCLYTTCTANLSVTQQEIINKKWRIMLEQDETRIEKNNVAMDDMLIRQTMKRWEGIKNNKSCEKIKYTIMLQYEEVETRYVNKARQNRGEKKIGTRDSKSVVNNIINVLRKRRLLDRKKGKRRNTNTKKEDIIPIKKKRIIITSNFFQKKWKGKEREQKKRRERKETEHKETKTLRNISQEKLIRSGDIETNPGPEEWDTPEIEREEIREIIITERERKEVPEFQLEEFMVRQEDFKEILKDRFYNMIYTCSCGDLRECLRKLTWVHTKEQLVDRNILGITIRDIFTGKKCAICLKTNYQVYENLLPKDYICSQNCEEIYLSKFIRKYKSSHRIRAMWLKEQINVKTIGNIGKTPNCGIHKNYKCCALDTIDYDRIQKELESEKNSKRMIKKRCKEAKQRFYGKPENMEKEITDVYSGAKCPGGNCLEENRGRQTTQYIEEYNIQTCSEKCRKEIEKKIEIGKQRRFGYHEIKGQITIEAIELKYLVQLGSLLSPRYSVPADSALEEYRRALLKRKKDTSKKEDGKLKKSSWVISFNMQGQTNTNVVREYVKKNKPAIIGLQEMKGINKGLQIVGYHLAQKNNDTAFMIREDIKINRIEEIGIEAANIMINIDSEIGEITIINIYARDGKLNRRDLETVNKKNKAIIIGDLNAKHDRLIPHTQKVKYNKNGAELLKHMEGEGEKEPSSWTIHNIPTSTEYTHTKADGDGWCQIDYIITTPDLTHLVDQFMYIDELHSDHKGIAVECERIISAVYRGRSYKETWDWKTFNKIKYKALTEAEIAQNLGKNGEEYGIEEKVNKMTRIMQTAMTASTKKKKRSNKGNTLPKWLLDKIREKNKRRRLLKNIEAEKRNKITEEIDILTQGVTEVKRRWDNEMLGRMIYKEEEIRKKTIKITKEINKDVKKVKSRKWHIELEGLARLCPRKATQRFWKKFNLLSGSMGGSVISSIEYNGKTGRSPKEIAEIMAEYAEESFQPLEDEKFNKREIKKIEKELEEVRNRDKTKEVILIREDKKPLSSYLKGKKMGEERGEQHKSNMTKHQKNMTGKKEEKISYKREKTSLPTATVTKLPVNESWSEKSTHQTKEGKARWKRVTERFKPKELEKALRRVKRKAPGKDGLYIDAYKNLGEEGKEVLLNMYNEMWEKGIYPEQWKEAILVPLLKKGKNGKKPESYRPISLLPVGGKILEIMVLARIVRYMEQRNLVPCYQTGFRKGYSTSVNIKRLYNNIYMHSARGAVKRPTAAIFFDAKKAFDSVWHEGLIHKMYADGLPEKIINFIHSWLDNRKLQVRIGEHYSRLVKLRSGVPQGSVLSPMLWNYWMGDCPAPLEATSDVSLYADDVGLWTTNTTWKKTVDEIQREIFRLTDWAKKKRIKFEPTKTVAIACHPREQIRRQMKQRRLYLNRDKTEPIQWEKKGRFLGVIFAENCTFNEHIRDITNRAVNRIKRLYRFRGYVKGETLYKVYKVAVEPLMLYGTEVLYENLTDINLKKLLAVEMFAIKTSYGMKRQESITKCLKHIDKSIVTNINNRRKNFVRRNYDLEILRHTETTKYSGGRRIRVRKQHTNRGTRKGWKEKLNKHKEILFMSDLDKENMEEKMEEQEKGTVIGELTTENMDRRRKRRMRRTPKIRIRIRKGKRENFQEGRERSMIWILESEIVPWIEVRYKATKETERQFDPG